MDNIDYVDMDIDKEIINGLSVVEGLKMKKLNISVVGDHLTSKNYSDTLSNEKSVIESLIEQAAKEIVSKIAANLNDS